MNTLTESPSLWEIGQRHQSDKSTKHYFTIAYELFLYSLRQQPVRLLEIGVLNGASLKMWAEYFPLGEIFGADIANKKQFDTDRIKTFIADQADPAQLSQLPKLLDIIIDDGGHTMKQQQISLLSLFGHLKPRGMYIIEDLHTSLASYNGKYGSNGSNSTLQMLIDMKKKKADFNPGKSYHISQNELYQLKESILFIEIIKTKKNSITAVIGKI